MFSEFSQTKISRLKLLQIYLFVHTLTIERAKVEEYIECHNGLHCHFTVYVRSLFEKKKKKRLKLQQKEYFFKFIYFNFNFWLCWVFVAARGLSLVAASGGYSSLWCTGFLLQWLLLLRSTGSRHVGFSSCGAWASVVLAHGLQQLWRAGCRVQAQQLWLTGLVAPRHVGSSRTRA